MDVRKGVLSLLEKLPSNVNLSMMSLRETSTRGGMSRGWGLEGENKFEVAVV